MKSQNKHEKESDGERRKAKGKESKSQKSQQTLA